MTKAVTDVVQRKNTQRMIDSNPTEIQFRRSTPQRKPNGGVEHVDQGFLPPQRVLLTQPRAQGKDSTTTAGTMNRQTNRLLAMPDADIKAGDTFTYDDTTWEVGHVVVKSYELYAGIRPRGDDADR